MHRLRSRIRSTLLQQSGDDRKHAWRRSKWQTQKASICGDRFGRLLVGCCCLSLLVFGLVLVKEERTPANNNSSNNKNSRNQVTVLQVAPDRVVVYPEKSYCDSAQTYIKLCSPQPSNCSQTVSKSFSTHGIGNALMIHYSREAEAVIQNTGCSPVLEDLPGSKDKDTVRFRLLDYVEVPKTIPQLPDGHTKVDRAFQKKCVVHALTQPLSEIQQKLDALFGQQEPTLQHLPLVALHVRTGWADETSRRKATWDKFTDELCQKASQTQSQIDPPTIYDTDVRSFDLRKFLDQLRDQANELYGTNQWRFFVASDAPYVKEIASDYLRDDYAGERALMTYGLVSHNFNGAMDRTPEENKEINENLMVDLIALSEASFLAHLPSKFPGSAALRSMCLEKTLVTPGALHPRHDLVTLGTLAEKFVTLAGKFDNETGTTPMVYQEIYKDLLELLPIDSTSCSSSQQPIMACLCWVKQSHERG